MSRDLCRARWQHLFAVHQKGATSADLRRNNDYSGPATYPGKFCLPRDQQAGSYVRPRGVRAALRNYLGGQRTINM